MSKQRQIYTVTISVQKDFGAVDELIQILEDNGLTLVKTRSKNTIYANGTVANILKLKAQLDYIEYSGITVKYPNVVVNSITGALNANAVEAKHSDFTPECFSHCDSSGLNVQLKRKTGALKTRIVSVKHVDELTALNVKSKKVVPDDDIKSVASIDEVDQKADSSNISEASDSVDEITKSASNNDLASRGDLTPKTPVPYFTAKQLASIYGITATPSQRANIAIIELGGGYKQSDLNAYWQYLGLTTIPNVYAVSVDGAKNTYGNDSDYEVVLDIEVIGGVCPNSNIYVYFAQNSYTSFCNAVSAAANDTAKNISVISISWGAPENSWSSSALSSMNTILQNAANKGITVACASGDYGSYDGTSSNVCDFPASSPYALACGGTSLTCPDFNYSSGTTREVVWGSATKNSQGGGGGFSSKFARPSYQTTALSGYSGTGKTGRGVPDVSGNADPNTGWVIYINGGYTILGGTSAVAPMYAGYLGSINYRKFFNTELYSLYNANKTGFHDILQGTNSSYVAGSGYDPASGLGSLACDVFTGRIDPQSMVQVATTLPTTTQKITTTSTKAPTTTRATTTTKAPTTTRATTKAPTTTRIIPTTTIKTTTTTTTTTRKPNVTTTRRAFPFWGFTSRYAASPTMYFTRRLY